MPPFAAACASMFVFGTVLALPGAVLALKGAVGAFELSLTQRGGLLAAFYGGQFAGTLVSGALGHRYGPFRLLRSSIAAAALLLVAFAIAPTLAAVAASLFALGFSTSLVNTASNALASELYPESRGRRMNTLALSVAGGGLTFAAASAFAAALIPWQALVFASASIAAVTAVSARRPGTSDPEVRPDAAGAPRAVHGLLREAGFPMLAGVLVLGAANEASMASWTAAYARQAGFTASAASVVLAGHWAGLIAGRALLPRYLERRKAAGIAAGGVVGGAAILAMVMAPSPVLAALGPALVGAAISIVVPTGLAVGGDRYPRYGSALFGALLMLAQAGALLAPPAIGVLADRTSLRAALGLVALNSAGVAWCAWRLSLSPRALSARR